MNILFLGDIVGKIGKSAVLQLLPQLRDEHLVDITIVNGENLSGGNGISGKSAAELLKSNIDVITMGDHVWDQRDIIEYLPLEPRILRPLNYPQGTPGNGIYTIEKEQQPVLSVINMQGQIFMRTTLENPFNVIERQLEELECKYPRHPIFIDFHAEATSEKIAFARNLDGRSGGCCRHSYACADC